MSKTFPLLIISTIFIFSIISLVYADCRTSLDDYAIEVLLSKPDIQHNIDSLKNAENVNKIGNSLVIQSASSPDIAVFLSEVAEPFCKDCVSLRIQVPVNRTLKEIPYIEFSSTIRENMNISQNIEDWNSNCLVSSCNFYKNNIAVFVDNTVENITELSIGITENPSVTYCGGKVIYSSSKAFCISRQNRDDIENLLKELKLINNFEEIFKSYSVDGSGMKTVYDFSPVLGPNLFSFLSNQNLTIDNKNNLESIRWDLIMNNEIEWMRFNGVVSLTSPDIQEISKLAKLGNSGINKRIYYGMDNQGDERWMYYYESSFPRITKSKNCESFGIADIPKSFVYITQKGSIKVNLYYLIPLVFSFALVVVLIILILISRKKIEKELQKERREILKQRKNR